MDIEPTQIIVEKPVYIQPSIKQCNLKPMYYGTGYQQIEEKRAPKVPSQRIPILRH